MEFAACEKDVRTVLSLGAAYYGFFKAIRSQVKMRPLLSATATKVEDAGEIGGEAYRFPSRFVVNGKRSLQWRGCGGEQGWGAYSTISKRYSSMTGLVRTSLEMRSSCFWASSRFQPSRFKTKNFPWRRSEEHT